MKRGFTIIELVMVLAILAVLLGIVATAAASSIKEARQKKAKACCRLVQAAFETFYTQKGYWPGKISPEGDNPDSCELSVNEVRAMMKDVLDEYKKGNPCLDISGLFVSRSSSLPRGESCKCGSVRYYPAKDAWGYDFMTAIHGKKGENGGQRMATSEMSFGYPHPDSGKFMPFRVVYSKPTDRVKVEQWSWHRHGGERLGL